MDIATRSLYFPPKGDDWETTSLADAGLILQGFPLPSTSPSGTKA